MRFGNRYSTRTYVRQAKRISSSWNRRSAASHGREDGKLELYGPPGFGEEFARECQWLTKQRQVASGIQAQAEKQVQEWLGRLQNESENHGRELQGITEKVSTLMTQSGATHCKLPTTSYRSTVIFFSLMFLFEFFFSAVSLITSGLVSIGFEIAIAIVAAGALVWLSEIVGTHLRQLPLSDDAGGVEHTRHYGVIVLSSMALVGILFGVNFLRSLANPNGTASGLSDTAHQVVQWALFAIGVGLVLTGVFRAGDHEYSGPRYGLAALERRRSTLQKGIGFCNSTAQRLNDFPAQLSNLLGNNVQRVFAVYADQYKRQALSHSRAVMRG